MKSIMNLFFACYSVLGLMYIILPYLIYYLVVVYMVMVLCYICLPVAEGKNEDRLEIQYTLFGFQ